MQILACVCDILAIFVSELRGLSNLIDLIADLVYCVYVCP